MKRHKITLPDELAEQVEQEAQRAGVPVATWIRMLVVEKMKSRLANVVAYTAPISSTLPPDAIRIRRGGITYPAVESGVESGSPNNDDGEP